MRRSFSCNEIQLRFKIEIKQKKIDLAERKKDPAGSKIQNPVYQQLTIAIAEADATVSSLGARVAEYQRRYGELLKERYRATPAEAGAKGNAAQGKHAPASPADASPYHRALSDTCVSPRATSRRQAP